MTERDTQSGTSSGAGAPRSALFNALIGLATLAILLQGLWAGIFLAHDGQRDAAESWINLHALGAYIAVVLSLAATIVAVVRLRARSDLVTASAVFLVLLIIETLLGGLVRGGTDALTVVHIPLAMFIMGMAVWIPLRARSRR